MTNLATVLRDTVDAYGSRTAVSVAGIETTYAEIHSLVVRFAAGLEAAGVEPGDRVALYLPNLPQYIVGFFGTLWMGGVVVPILHRADPKHVEYVVGDSCSQAVLTICDSVSTIERFRSYATVERVVTADGNHPGGTSFSSFLPDRGSAPVNRADGDVAVAAYTVGTTGAPTGVHLTHENIGANARAVRTHVLSLTHRDDQLGAIPLGHPYGIVVTVLATVLAGACYHPMSTWRADRAIATVERDRITHLHGTPAMYADLLEVEGVHSADLSSLRFCGVGGLRVPTSVIERFEDAFERPLYEGYGLTEAGSITHYNVPGDRRVGSVGKPLPVVDSAVVTEEFGEVPRVERGPVTRDDDIDLERVTGELVVAGPNVMCGYVEESENDDAFTVVDGTRILHTGDLAYHDRDGFVYVVDRADSVVETDHGPIFSSVLEDRILTHDGVGDAAVVGLENGRDRIVTAFVVPTHSDTVTRESIKAHCKLVHDGPYPERLAFVSELPRTAIGTVMKYKLRQHVLD